MKSNMRQNPHPNGNIKGGGKAQPRRDAELVHFLAGKRDFPGGARSL